MKEAIGARRPQKGEDGIELNPGLFLDLLLNGTQFLSAN